MSNYNSVNDEIKAQGAKVKNMPVHKRLGYYFYYYKWIILVILAAALFIYFIAKSIISNQKPIYLTGVFMNSNTSSGHEALMEQAFADYYGIDLQTYSIDFDYSLGYNIEDPTDSLSTYTPPKMVAYSEGRVGDFVLCDTETFDFFAGSGYFADLSEIVTPEQLSRYQDFFYYFDAGDGRGSIPVAVRLEDTQLLHSMSCYRGMDDIYFSVFYNSQHKDHALDFLEFICSESD